ncbi:hypothetical protein SAMN04487770_1102 [Butyrivibrio sp. ob235]|nr:cupin domain-containing protein [Butyrivibrio sp. ob235]SEL40786.1 hypothetical protein SAMN04487770_1102 [Butyrivibrio sp. ob235]
MLFTSFGDTEYNQKAMAVIPKGAIFAAENLDKSSYCFTSCATTPKFTYDGFRLVSNKEIRDICSADYEKIKHLASCQKHVLPNEEHSSRKRKIWHAKIGRTLVDTFYQ